VCARNHAKLLHTNSSNIPDPVTEGLHNRFSLHYTGTALKKGSEGKPRLSKYYYPLGTFPAPLTYFSIPEVEDRKTVTQRGYKA